MSRVNSEILAYFNVYSWEVLRDYVKQNEVKFISYDGTNETLVSADWVGMMKRDGYGILYASKKIDGSLTLRGIQIGNWKYYFLQEKNLSSGLYYINLRLKFDTVTEVNYS